MEFMFAKMYFLYQKYFVVYTKLYRSETVQMQTHNGIEETGSECTQRMIITSELRTRSMKSRNWWFPLPWHWNSPCVRRKFLRSPLFDVTRPRLSWSTDQPTAVCYLQLQGLAESVNRIENRCLQAQEAVASSVFHLQRLKRFSSTWRHAASKISNIEHEKVSRWSNAVMRRCSRWDPVVIK